MKKKCLDCDKEVSPNAQRCRKCARVGQRIRQMEAASKVHEDRKALMQSGFF